MSQYEKPPSWSNNYVKEGIVISIMSKMHIVWSITGQEGKAMLPRITKRKVFRPICEEER